MQTGSLGDAVPVRALKVSPQMLQVNCFSVKSGRGMCDVLLPCTAAVVLGLAILDKYLARAIRAGVGSVAFK